MDFGQLLQQMKRLTGTLSTRQLVTMAVVFLAVVGLVGGSAYWMNAPTYGLLYADMDAEAAAEIVTRLKSENVPYQLDAGGRAVRVPVDRIDELRLSLAAQALPGSGRIGFEIFDRTQFGATEFLEHVNYRRALEGELARTIGSIAEVQTARVHIAMAKESLFASGAEPAKASVVLKLRRNAPLAPATINGIAGLVSASVESLRPESVVIVDTYGRRLSGGAPTDAETGEQLDKQKRLERDLTQKVIALLEPVVGSDRVRVNVSARLSSNSQEETEERFAPETVVRSRQTTSDTTLGAIQGRNGQSNVAGSRGNAPDGSSTAEPPVADAAATQPGNGRSAETTNYEVSKVTRHTIAPPGQVARLSVAVIVDDERVTAVDATGKSTTTGKPRSPEALQRIQQLVATSVGLDTERGDQITVENISFTEPAPETPEPPPAWWQRVVPTGQAAPIARGLGVFVLAALALLLVVRPMVQKAFTPSAIPTVVAELQPARTVADIEGELEANLDQLMLGRGDGRVPALTKRLAKVADQEPEQMAKLVRSWLNEGEN